MNESAISSAWLVQRVGEADSPGPTQQWRLLADAMRTEEGDQDTALAVDSDPWLCKSQAIVDGRSHSIWVPPPTLDDFASGPLHADTLVRWRARQTQHARLDAIIADQRTFPPEMIVGRSNLAIKAYRRLIEATTPPFSDPKLARFIVMLNQVNAWLDLGLGAPFRTLLLTPARTAADLDAQAGATVARVEEIISSAEDDDAFLQRTLERTHNGVIASSDGSLDVPTRGGQTERWRERWGWLSQECTSPDALQAVVLAAQLLANIGVIAPLVHLTNSTNRAASLIAICSLRRVMLTLRVMAWAEEALRSEWQLVRPKDILCFAYAAFRPQQPRPAVALSHRSRTVKPLLFKSSFWVSPFAALDATSVPQWETNLAMIWGLFASVPAIVRMPSLAYSESEWCQRESELIDFVSSQYDFVRNRHLIDLEESAAPGLDEVLAPPARVQIRTHQTVRSITPPLLTESEAALLTAAGAVRFINAAALAQAEDTVQAVRALRRGVSPDIWCPTNNADGWRTYVEIFQRVARLRPMPDDAPVFVPDEWTPATTLRFPEIAKYLPDFNDSRVPGLCDHLAACEWILVEEQELLRAHGHASVIVDCRPITREDWERRASYSLHRGLTSAPTRVPLWFVQRANEDVDRWPTIGDYRPIFTQHLPDQFSWMELVPPSPDWFERYMTKSGLRW